MKLKMKNPTLKISGLAESLITRLMLLCGGVMTLVSCNHKELCMDHPHSGTVRVVFDWKDAPEADPEGMCVFFYPINGTNAPARRFDFSNRMGGEIEIQEGVYRVLFYNNDTEVVSMRGIDDFELHEGYTREGGIFEPIYGNTAAYAPRAADTEDERVVISPDMLWGCSTPEVEVIGAGNQEIVLYPHELVCTYTYEVRNVKNLKYATQMCGSLSSMSPSLYIGSEELHRDCVTLPFASVSDGKSMITGKFLTFGHHLANEKPHSMVLYVWFVDGSKYYYTYDVTDQIHNAPDPRHVHLILDGLEFPQPIVNGNGFSPSVDDWVTVNTEVVM